MENEDENQESGLAKSHIKLNRGLLVRQFAGDVDPTFGIAPISIFMAGSPGAGKTEFSRRLIEGFQSKPIVIDADDIRKIIPGYLGGNSHVYQAAATKGVHILYDYALEKKLNMILDGTFAYRLSIENVNRSLTRGRKVEIYYIYQEPKIAWIFTKKREELENRKVTLGLFINTFIVARENVIKAKKIFGDKIKLNLVLKNYDTKTEKIYLDVSDIDDMLFRGYSVEDLQMILGYN